MSKDTALMDKSFLTNWRFIVFIPLMYLLYGVSTILPMYGFIYGQQWAISIAFIIILLMVLTFAFLFEILREYTKIAVLESDKKAWLQLHLFFLISSTVFSYLFLFPISLWLTFQVEPNLRAYPVAWLLGIMGFFPYFVNKLRGILGMRTVNLRGDSITGARAFAMLARTIFQRQDRKEKGIDYLNNATRMLNSSLLSEGIQIETLNKASLILHSFQFLDSEIDHDKLVKLSSDLENSNGVKNVIDSIEEFLGKGKDIWHKKITPIERKKSSDTFLKAITLGIMIISVFVATFSENLKNQVSSLFSAISWSDILIIVVIFALYFFLVRSFSYFLSRGFDPRDLAKLDVTQQSDRDIESPENASS